MNLPPLPINFADIPMALQSLRPGAQWVFRGDQYSGLEWLDQVQTCPTEEEVNDEIARLNIQIPLGRCSEEAKKRVAASDWSVLPDVNISNKSDFEAYRAALRQLIFNPVANPVWPVEPDPVWV